MKVIGLVGGVASGKSLVAKELQRLGATSLDVDGFGHEVLREPDVITQIKERFGTSVLDEDSQVERKKLAEIVFAVDGDDDLKQLESITHPRIEQRIRTEIQRLAESKKFPAVVLDAAVMLKAGWYKHCDVIVFVDCPEELRRERALQRGWSVEQFEFRESSQISIDRKRAIANIVIDNSGGLEQTYEQVLNFWCSSLI